MRPDPYFERCTSCEEQIHYLQYIFTKDHFGLSLCSPCERKFRSKRIRTTLKDLQPSGYSLQDNISTLRKPNRLVNDRIAETVKSIRHLYDVKKNKTGGKPGSLL